MIATSRRRRAYGLVAALVTVTLTVAFGVTACESTRFTRDARGPTTQAVIPCPADSGKALASCRPARVTPSGAAQCGPTLVSRAFGRAVLGPGPVYPGGQDRQTIRLRRIEDPRAFDQPGGPWYVTKVIWLVAPGYSGGVLLRIFPVGHNGQSRLQLRDVFATQVYLPASPSRGVRDYPSYTAVTRAGCYVWQVDGRDFSYTVFFRAQLDGA